MRLPQRICLQTPFAGSLRHPVEVTHCGGVRKDGAFRPTKNVAFPTEQNGLKITIQTAKSIVQLLIMKLVVQIPAYNEAGHLPVVLSDIPRQFPGVDEVIILVIDDGSTDNTSKVALENGADYVLRHRRNRGLSRAFISGVQFALALGADIIVNTDADNQYPGSEISKLIAPILADQADMVIGDRQTLANKHFSRGKRLMEHLGSSIMRQVSKTDVPDAVSGFRAFSRYAALRLQVYNPYSYTLETLVQAGKGQMELVNVPIRTNPALRESRLHKGVFNFIWRQSGAIIRSYVLYQPLRTFVSIGSLLLLTGLILIGRFLVGYLFLDLGSRYIQSVSIGGTLLTAGVTLIMFGFLGDAMRANRQAAEETMISQRDQTRLPQSADLRDFQGHPIYSASNPPAFDSHE